MFNQLPKFSATIASLAFGAAMITSPAQAAIVTYDFTVNVTEGALAGQSYRGTFSYDDSLLKGTGAETLGVEQGLTVCMNYFGKNYTAANDRDYPNFPKLAFENGEIEHLDFWVQPNDRVVWWNLPGWEIDLSLRSPEADASNCQGQ